MRFMLEGATVTGRGALLTGIHELEEVFRK